MFIGDGEQYKEVKSILEENFKDRFILLGSKKHHEIIDYYSAADLSILPSLMEATSISGLEAMAASLPLVGTDVGGIPVIIKDGINGFLCESHNEQDLAQKIDKLLDSDYKIMDQKSKKIRKNMKIVQILGGVGYGGLEKHVIELTHSIKNSNIDISVIANKNFKKDFDGINFIELDLSKGRRNPFILYKLYKILKQENFDIIHTQASKATDMVIRLRPFLKAKIISTLHSYKKDIKSFEKSDFVITVSDKIGEKLKNTNKITIYNGIKQEEIKHINLYKKYNIKKDKFIICSVGRLVDVKRYDVLIKSIKDIDVHLILVGKGKREKELKDLSKDLNIENKITFIGELENKEVKELIASSNLYIITSQREGFSYTFAESLVLKTPLLSTDVADIKKTIGKDYITPFGDSEKLSHKIESIKLNYDIILKKFESSFKFATNEFTKENMVKKTIDIYKKVMI